MANRIVIFLSIASCGWAQELIHQSNPQIKWMSETEIHGYLAGHGMGLAKAAELNHHPGPKHVLELSAQLQLTHEQRSKAQKIYDDMHEEAVRLGKLFIEKEAALDSLFSQAKMGERQLHELVSEIGRINGELRFVHLKAHLAMKAILSENQIAEYDRLRGYSNSKNESHKHQQHH